METERFFIINQFFTKHTGLKAVLSMKPVHMAKRGKQTSDL